MLSTAKLFIIIAVVFVLIFVFVIGFNPFSFVQPYFDSRNASPVPSPAVLESLPSPSAPIVLNPDPDRTVIPDPTTFEPSPLRIDR